MAITDIPILSMLRTRLDWSQERQNVLAENVANADTPNYRARDLAPLKFETAGRSRAASCRCRWRAPSPATSPAPGGRLAVSHGEATTTRLRPTGNAVSLEDEMMKVAANQMDFQAATALYTRSLD